MTLNRNRHWVLGLFFVGLLAGHPEGQVIGDRAMEMPKRPKLTDADINDLATLLRLEDTRQFDEAALRRILQSENRDVRRRTVVSIGRIVNPMGSTLLEIARKDPDFEVVASTAFSAGQLKDAGAVAWLDGLLAASNTPGPVGREAAQSLGKIQTADARASLERFLNAATSSMNKDAAIGEALLALGRFPPGGDLTPLTRWMTARNEEFRWRAAWAMFRARDPKAVPHLLKLADDGSPEVRFWAVRGLLPAPVDQAGLDRKVVIGRLLAGTKDRDRRVRTESLRTLLQYDDDIAFGALIDGLASPDTWISTSAAESVGRFTAKRGDELKPKLIAAGAAAKPVWLRNLVLTPLVTLSPETAIEVATSLARSGVAAARSSAVTALGRLGDAGRARLEELNSDPALKGLLPAPGGRGGGGGGARPTPTPRSEAEYRALVLKWIVPAYNGKANPRAIWETPRGKIELELRPGDSPLGAEYFVQSIASGDIVGTEFTRVVPNFVAQQASIRNAALLRDETNRGGLLRGTLAWATAGLDTGRPGYTLGTTPQPHNESNYTSLGRVVSGMDVVDMLEWGDRILAARMK